MDEFEDRVRRALAAGAEDAPVADSLVAQAQRRRRTRRVRVAVAGTAAAVVAIAVPAAVIAGTGNDADVPVTDRPTTPQTPDAGVEWQTVTYDKQPRGWAPIGGVAVDIPADWVNIEQAASDAEVDRCSWGHYARVGDAPCGWDARVAFYPEATYDPPYQPGQVRREEPSDPWAGYAIADDWAVWVSTPDRDLTRAILDTVREN